MNRLIEVQTRRSIELTRQIASSGEGSVWRTNCSGLLAKVYHQPSVERIQKLEVMLKNPPEEMLAHIGHTSYAWPVAILENEKGQRVGFLMPEIKQGRQLTEIYNPSLRKRLKLEVDWKFLHTTAYNFALLMESIHRAGYVIGDVKPENILVNPQALPSIIDTDSFQVRDPKGHIYRCPVGSEGFTPPELIGKNFKEIDQTEVHDRFRLGVIVFTLLFGYEPFKGVWKGGGEPPELNEWVKHNYWPYSGNGKVGLADYMMPLDIVHPELQNLFLRCFNDGYSVPAMRPSAREWRLTLGMAIAELQVCGVVETHLYHRGNSSCCWCERTAKGLPDIFLFNRTVPRVISERKSQSATVSHPSNKTPTAVSHHPTKTTSFLVYYNRGSAKYKLKDYQGAIDEYTEAININPNYNVAYNDRGFVKYKLKDYQGAIDDYTQAIRIAPNYALAYYNRGNAKYKLQDYQGAVDDYTEAININPNYSVAYNDRGFVKYKLKDYQGAIDDYTQAIRIAPNYALAYYNRGNAKYELQDYQGAINDYTQAINISPNYNAAYYKRGNAKYKLQDYQGAVDDYTQAIRIAPNYALAYYNRGNAKYELQDYQGAINDYTQAIRINPNDADAYCKRGLAKIDSNDRSGGCADLSRAINLGSKLASRNYQKYCR